MFVYLVSSGEYSDYGINRIFSTKEKAEKWIGECIQHYTLAEWKVDDESEPQRFTSWVSMGLETGNVYSTGRNINDPARIRIFRDDSYHNRREMALEVSCETDDITRAVKICSEKRMQLLALNRIDPGIYDYDTLECKTKW